MLEKEVDGTNYHLGIIKKCNLISLVTIHNGRNYGIKISCDEIEKAVQLLDFLNLNPQMITEICKQYNPIRDVYLSLSEITEKIKIPLRNFEEIKNDERYSGRFNSIAPPIEDWII